MKENQGLGSNAGMPVLHACMRRHGCCMVAACLSCSYKTSSPQLEDGQIAPSLAPPLTLALSLALAPTSDRTSSEILITTAGSLLAAISPSSLSRNSDSVSRPSDLGLGLGLAIGFAWVRVSVRVR